MRHRSDNAIRRERKPFLTFFILFSKGHPSQGNAAMLGGQLGDLPLPRLRYRTKPKSLAQVTELQILVIACWPLYFPFQLS
jgi:hypothetical protein